MIADLDETIKQLLINDLPVKNGEIDIRFDQPTREWSSRLTRPTINLFLYDLRENATLRRHQWEKMSNGNGRPDVAAAKRTPFRVDCHYMVTAWASDPEDEHRLMTRTMLALFRHPILPEPVLQGEMVHQPYDVPASLARHDKLTNPAEVWGSLDNEMRPGVSYLVTIALDPWSEVSGPIVRSMTMRTGQATRLPGVKELDPAATEPERVFIGGTVWEGDSPQSGITVAVKDSGFTATTGQDGRFRLGTVRPGSYTLLAWPPTDKKGKQPKPVERAITVPAEDGDYDLKL
ncbi:MAG: Pvc16 family protein [Candidatus Promineifilaceae bacterium]